MNKLMDWMKGKFMKYHISDKEYDMIQADMQEENRNSLLFFSVITNIVSVCYAFNFFLFSCVCKISVSLHTTDACSCAYIGRYIYEQK